MWLKRIEQFYREVKWWADARFVECFLNVSSHRLSKTHLHLLPKKAQEKPTKTPLAAKSPPCQAQSWQEPEECPWFLLGRGSNVEVSELALSSQMGHSPGCSQGGSEWMNLNQISQLCGSLILTTQPQQGKQENHTFLQKGNLHFHTIHLESILAQNPEWEHQLL